MINITNILVRELWTADIILGSDPLNSLVNSRAVITDASISKMVNAADAGTKILIPYIIRPAISEPKIGNDSDTKITARSIAKGEISAAIGFYNESFGVKSITQKIGAGQDGFEFIVGYFGTYWKGVLGAQIKNMLLGAVESNIANNDSDNVLVNTTKQFSYDLAVDTLELAGEKMDDFDLVIMHSKTKALIKKFSSHLFVVKDFEDGSKVEFFDGKQVIVDNLGLANSTDDTVDTFFVKVGGIIFCPKTNTENTIGTKIDETDGNGSGSEQVVSRFNYLLTLNGYSYTGAEQADVSPSFADFANPINWERKVEAEDAPFVCLRTKLTPAV